MKNKIIMMIPMKEKKIIAMINLLKGLRTVKNTLILSTKISNYRNLNNLTSILIHLTVSSKVILE